MINYEKEGQDLLAFDKHEEYIKLVKKGMLEFLDEDLLAHLVGALYERQITDGYWLIEAFVGKYPNSLHIIRVYLADLFAQQGKFDLASNEARTYLWLLKKSGVLSFKLENQVLLEGIARSFLLITSVYTEVGAKNYSIRALHEGMNYKLPKSWLEYFDLEVKRIESELSNESQKTVDSAWESFFKVGDNFEYVSSLCDEKKFAYLSKRVQLIKDNFRFNTGFSVNSDELIMLVHQVEDNKFILT